MSFWTDAKSGRKRKDKIAGFVVWQNGVDSTPPKKESKQRGTSGESGAKNAKAILSAAKVRDICFFETANNYPYHQFGE